MRNPQKRSYLRVAADAIANGYRAQPAVFWALVAVSALLCAVEVGEIYAMRRLFDATGAFVRGRIPMSAVFPEAVPMILLLLATPLVQIAEYLGQGYFWRRGSGYLMARYHESIQRIPLIDFERAETFDLLRRAQLGSEAAPSAGRSFIQFAFHFVPYLGLMSAFLFQMQPMLALALLILFASTGLAQALRAGILRRFEEANAGLRRRTEYYESCIAGKALAKETRTLGAVGYFFRLFADAAARLGKATMAAERRICAIELLLRAINILGYMGILAMLVHSMVRGDISVGDFAAVFYSLERISGVLRVMVAQIGEAAEEMSAAAFTHAFLQGKEAQDGGAALDKRADLRLDRVSFAYPGGENVLTDVDLTIRQGETVALVGENGAGKTTLTKVILGLYEPTAGAVRYGDEAVYGHAAKPRFRRVSAVFQNFVRYRLSLQENIRLGEADANRDTGTAARAAGAAFEMAGDPEAALSREFGGAELSGGQWQRVAIARGLYRAHDVIVFDEPTSAIDPIEEMNLFELFRASAEGKTAIWVTHRLGSTRIADRILVLEGGRVIEAGTHKDLMALDGRYARMYREQAGWYQR